MLWRREQRFESPTASTPPVRIETFGYDRLNRLKYSQVTGQALQTFTFTANGNINSKSGIGSYAYGERNHGPHAVTSVSQGTQVQRSYTYDAKGRMTGEFNGATLTGFALRDIKYTSFDQPKTITHLGAAALSSDSGQLDDGTTAWNQACTIDFYFGPGLQRLIQKKVKGKLATTTLSLGGYEIREVTGHTGTVIEREERSSFGNGVRVMRWLGPKETTSAQTSYEFAAKDHLGSDTATFDGQGQLRQQRGHLKPGEVQKTERQSYDAWGARRDGDTWAPAAGQLKQLTPAESTMTAPSQAGGAPSGSPPERAGSNLPRGYTGHEMLDDVGLVHMNGRLYDSALGRMCAADPYVQSTEAIQNYNRYSYVMNNPMNATDPSGLSWLSKWWKVIVAVIIAIIIAIVAAYLMGALLNALGGALGIGGAAGGAGGTAAAAAGATIGTSGITATGFGIIAVGAGVQAGMTAYSMTKGGASFGSILKAVVVSAAISGATAAISANALHGLGEAVGSYGSGVTNTAFAEAATKGGFAVTGNMVADRVIGTIIHGAAHGVVGGAAAAAQGGSFKSGFISAVVSFGVDVIGIQTLGGKGGIYDMSNKSPMAVAGRTAVAAISGGMASVATGGKFTQAAFTAGFMHLFNTEGVENVLAIADRFFSTKSDPYVSIVLYDGADPGWSDEFLGEGTTGKGFEHFANLITGGYKNQMIDISQTGWQSKYDVSVARLGGYLRRVIIADHGSSGAQEFGNVTLSPSGSDWHHITQGLNPARVVLMLTGCNVANGPVGAAYLTDLSRYGSRFSVSSTKDYPQSFQVTGYTGFVMHGRNRGAVGGSFVSRKY